MSNYMSKGSLYTKICSQESEVTGMQEQRIKAVCTGTVSTGSEEIKQHEIITIWGNRVRAGRVPMLATDVVWLVFGLGLLGVVHRQGEMMLEDAEECNN